MHVLTREHADPCSRYDGTAIGFLLTNQFGGYVPVCGRAGQSDSLLCGGPQAVPYPAAAPSPGSFVRAL